MNYIYLIKMSSILEKVQVSCFCPECTCPAFLYLVLLSEITVSIIYPKVNYAWKVVKQCRPEMIKITKCP